MTFLWAPLLAGLALVPVLAGAYVALQRRRARAARALAGSGLVVTGAGRLGWRRHVPFALLLAALAVMVFALSRPQATLARSRSSGTVLLLIDVSNSMAATDAEPTRLGVAQDVARRFIEAQPASIDVGVVAFGAGALVTQQPTADRVTVLDAIDRLKTGGQTSVGHGLLVAMSTIAGTPIALPEAGEPAPAPGYFPSASILLVTDGEDTGGPNPAAVAAVAAESGVQVSAVGVGTADGTTITVEGYQVATALDEQGLADLVAITGGRYEPAAAAAEIVTMTDSLERHVTSVDETAEITAAFALVAIGLLLAGGALMVRWFGRVV